MKPFNLSLSPRAMRRVAIGLCVAVLGLLTFGIIMLCSTSSFYANERYGSPYVVFWRQAMWLGIGLIACIVAACLDYRLYRKYVWWILGAAAVLLVAVLFFGTIRNGAKRWLVFGPVSFQPSEFAKLALVIFLAFWLEKMHRKARGKLHAQIRHPFWGFALPLGVAGVLAALIFIQPDVGTVVLLLALTTILLWVAGSNPYCLAGLVWLGTIGGVALMTAIIKFGFLAEKYQAKRIVAWWTGDDPMGINWQQLMALLAFGSGGPWGVGLGESCQKMLYLPEAHTDFILPIIGEELGVFGPLAVVIAFAALVVCGMLLTTKAPDLFGMLLGTGIVASIALQAMINIAVVTNSIPNKGMPLPFISYGGSNLLMLLASVGILLSIARQGHAQITGQFLDPSKEKQPAVALPA